MRSGVAEPFTLGCEPFSLPVREVTLVLTLIRVMIGTNLALSDASEFSCVVSQWTSSN